MYIKRAKGGGQINKLYLSFVNKDCARVEQHIKTTTRVKILIDFIEEYLITKLPISKDTYDKYFMVVDNKYKNEIERFTMMFF